MTEYIEREAAIAALNKVRDDQRVFKYTTASDFLSARGEIERAAKVLESLPAADVEPVQEWIPVEGRTPGNTGLYLVIEKHWLDGSLGIKIAKWNTVDWFTADRKSKKITPRVTHWMPMPPLPKGE